MLARELGRGIRAERIRDHAFMFRKFIGIAISTAGSGEDEPAGAGDPGGLEQVEGRGRPAGVRLERLEDRPGDAGDGRMVQDLGHSWVASRQTSKSARSPSSHSNEPSRWARFERWPVAVVDHPDRPPLALGASTRCEPMNPAPPVTNTRPARILPMNCLSFATNRKARQRLISVSGRGGESNPRREACFRHSTKKGLYRSVRRGLL